MWFGAGCYPRAVLSVPGDAGRWTRYNALSYANRTPWDSPRELDEDALYARFKRLAQQLEHPRTAIFNLHVPPFDSGLDRAVHMDAEDLTAVFNDGAPHEIPVGSRAGISDPPLMIAECSHSTDTSTNPGGAAKIGTTLALNRDVV